MKCVICKTEVDDGEIRIELRSAAHHNEAAGSACILTLLRRIETLEQAVEMLSLDKYSKFRKIRRR